MTAVRTIDFDRLRDVTEELGERDRARETAVASMRLIESNLIAALAGHSLRGLTNLAPPWHKVPYYAQRVHVASEGVRYRGLPKAGHPVLVIAKTGHIALSRVAGDDRVIERLAADDELQAEDCEPVANAYAEVVDRHIARMDRANEVHSRAITLAKRLAAALRS